MTQVREPLTVRECDDRLRVCAEAVRAAKAEGDDTAAEAAQASVDDLLDRRNTIRR